MSKQTHITGRVTHVERNGGQEYVYVDGMPGPVSLPAGSTRRGDAVDLWGQDAGHVGGRVEQAEVNGTFVLTPWERWMAGEG